MKVAKIKFAEEQVRMLITGKTVIVNLPDAQIHLTMDMTRIERKKAADGFAGVGKKSNPFRDSDFDDFMGNSKSDSKSDSFKDMFGDLFGKKR